jgi:hypothetical protein
MGYGTKPLDNDFNVIGCARAAIGLDLFSIAKTEKKFGRVAVFSDRT